MCRLTFHAARRLVFVALVALVSAASGATVAEAAVPWHPSLEQAKAAAAISRRPVLVVFGASWSDASVALQEKTLTNPEAIAIVTACFEPVKIDVDIDPATTKKMGVTYLPTACVIDQDDRVLASFDCPDSPASFIAAAGKAVQDAAAARQPAPAIATTPAVPSQPVASAAPAPAATIAAPASAPAPATPATGSVFSSAAPPAVASERFASRPLSRFSSAPAAPTAAAPAAPSGWPAESPATSLSTALPPAPSLAPWDAPSPVASPTVTTAARPTIEPAPAQAPPQPSGMASWLGDSAQRSPPPASSAVTYGSTVPQPYPAPSATPQPAPAPAVAAYGAAPPPAAAAEPAAPEKPTSSNAFLAALQRPFSLFSSTPKVEKAEPTTPPAVPAAAKVDPYGTMPLGMEGYCPVTLAEKGQWVEGRAQWGARHRGRTYLFAGEAQQRAFLADPDRFAPALSGDDAVMAFDAGKSVPGQRRYGVTYQSRIYLFSSPESRTTFSANPQRYTARVAMAENPPAPSGTILR
jgi:YHS domain-containing protein